ncbi:MAG: hypothetical protein ACODAJ_03210 [Planctomycetota bacterium]
MGWGRPLHAVVARIALWLAAAGAVQAAEPFDYFANSWNVIGLKDYQHGARITPTNEILLAGKAKLTLRVGRDLRPLGDEPVKTCLGGWMPVILITARDGDLRYDFKLWATPLPTVKDWRKAFDWPTEGENFLCWVRVAAMNAGGERADAKVRADVAGKGRSRREDFAWTLAPGKSAEAVVRVPFARVGDSFAQEDAERWLRRTVDYWRGLMDEAARITVPCRKATEAMRAAHVCQLIANDHGQLQGGEGFYDHFYIRDGGYQILELEEAGLWDAAARAIDFYLRAQRPDGRFETQKNQLDANGQALWVLWQYWKITGDKTWLAKAYPRMAKAVAWIRQARRKAPADAPFAGLLPAAPADGEYLWDGKHHIVGYDFWNLRGLLCTADAARVLGRGDEADAMLAEAEDYRAAIDAAHQRTGVPYFPPSWEGEGTHWGNTETLWPTELFTRDDPRVAALDKHVREDFGGGYVEGTIRWMGRPGVIHPYMGSYTTMASLLRGGREQFVEDFYWYLLHTTATHAFPEGIYYKRRFAWSHTIPHVTGASNFAFRVRHMLVHERGDQLDLLLAVPDWWLADGQTVRVERAPTHFGEMGMTVTGEAEGVRVELDRPTRQPPRRITLTLPESRPLLDPLHGVEVVIRPDQAKRWDFPTVVKLYEETRWKPKPIEGLVELPLAKPIPSERCRLLDLAKLANTDPFTAPFGVPQPRGSRYLFTGLPVGDRVVGGVPFRILNPEKNEGAGLLVLHSPKAPQDIEWPKQVEIPVGRQGRRLFFLGNVHGWGVNDAGAGEWGAVAEYVIHYADGATQTVPLITGRTAEDWTRPPEATDVHCGLRGKTWHLNVLGAALRPGVIEKIVFRDLGTPAAPVLVAVTLQH